MWGRSRRPAGVPPAPSPGRHGAAGREEAQVRQGVDAGARQRPLGPGGDPAGLPLARRVQAARARRAGPAVPPGHDASSTSARRRAAGRRCCASGSAPPARIVAIDLLPMDPIAGVAVRPGATSASDDGLAAVEAALDGRQVDLVVSDMAPNLSGVESADQARSVHLGELALEFAAPMAATRRRSASSRRSRARASRSSSGRCSGISTRSTCASPSRRAIAAARSTWWASGCRAGQAASGCRRAGSRRWADGGPRGAKIRSLSAGSRGATVTMQVRRRCVASRSMGPAAARRSAARSDV